MLHGERLTLRPLDRAHAAQTLAWANDPELARLMDRARPVSDVEHEQWFAGLHQRQDCLYLAVVRAEDGAHVGNVWLWAIDPRHRRAEVRIVIDRRAQGGGTGTEALRLVSDVAFQRLNLHKLYAYVLATNPRARRAFEKAGFTLEGCLTQDRWVGDHYADVFLLGKLSPQAPPGS